MCILTPVAPTAFINGLTTTQVTAAAGDNVTFTCFLYIYSIYKKTGNFQSYVRNWRSVG